MTNFETWKENLKPEDLAGCHDQDGTIIDIVIRCQGCPAENRCDELSNKAPGRLIHCWDNFKTWSEGSI
jgi:hypothetical protein